MSKSKFCKAGKIECGKYHLGRDADGILEYCQVSGEPISGWDSCPHIPQMEPLDSYNKNYLREQYIAWHDAGFAECKRLCVEEVEKLKVADDPDADMYQFNQGIQSAIAALEAVEVKNVAD